MTSQRMALIIGATGGIGTATARELSGRGYALRLNGRREPELRALAEELQAEYVVGDCNDAGVIAELAGDSGQVDVLVHTAGILRGTVARDQSVEVFDEVIRVNLSSVYLAVHEVLPVMTAGARIILVSSTAATRPMRGLTAYSAAKAGVNAMAAALSGELESTGINVSLVSPGPVDTPMMRRSANAISSLSAGDVGSVIGFVADLPPGVMMPNVEFRAPFRGPFASVAGGHGTAGVRLGGAVD